MRPRLIARLIDWHNPGVTFLFAVWAAGWSLRDYLARRGALGSIANEALLSLILVVPLMLVGWAALAFLQHRARRPDRSR